MKSERRHELQHNELAAWLLRTSVALKPYQNWVFGGVLAVLAIAAGLAIWSRVEASATAKAWDDLGAAMNGGNASELAKVIDEHPDTTAAQMAALVLADNYLGTGCNQLFSNKPVAQDELKKAIRRYDSVRQECRVPSLVDRATFGLARAKESMGDAASLKEAEQLYAEVASKTPAGAFTVAAAQRLTDLKRPATKTLYDDFRKFDPKPAFSAEGEKPAFEQKNLPVEGAATAPASPLKLTVKADDKAKDAPANGGKDAAKPRAPAKPSDAAKPAEPAKNPEKK